MSVPDQLAGKTVRCPKCGGSVPIRAPAFEVVETEATPPTRTRPGTVPDDDERDEERPRRRPPAKPARAARHGAGMVLAAVGGAVALGAVAFGVYWFALRATPAAGPVASNAAPTAEEKPGRPPLAPGQVDPGATAQAPAVPAGTAAPSAEPFRPPAGWKEFVSDDEEFAAYFPATPTVSPVQKREPYTTRDKKTVVVTARDYTHTTPGDYPDLTCRVTVLTFTPVPHPAEQLAAALVRFRGPNESSDNAGVASPQKAPVTLGGRPAEQWYGQRLFPVAARGKIASDGRPYPEKLVSRPSSR
jgi:hypothetical protein